MNTFCVFVLFFFLSKPVDCINLENRKGKNQDHYQQLIRKMLIKIINIYIWWPIATYNWNTVHDLINAHFQINAPLYIVKIILDAPL